LFKKGGIPTYEDYDMFVEGSEIEVSLDLTDLYVGIYNSEIAIFNPTASEI